jgi:hypothetical protein
LAGDLLEEQGRISQAEALEPGQREDSLPILAQRIAPVVSMPLSFVEMKLSKLSDRGLIICQQTPGFDSWEWKEEKRL